MTVFVVICNSQELTWVEAVYAKEADALKYIDESCNASSMRVEECELEEKFTPAKQDDPNEDILY